MRARLHAAHFAAGGRFFASRIAIAAAAANGSRSDAGRARREITKTDTQSRLRTAKIAKIQRIDAGLDFVGSANPFRSFPASRNAMNRRGTEITAAAMYPFFTI